MRYALLLLPDAFLLVALLRMAFVGLAVRRPAMFFFLCAWLLYSLVALFLGQIWPIESHEYALRFFVASLAAWLCGIPALWAASRRLGLAQVAFVLLILLLASGASHFALDNSALSSVAKLLAVQCWVAVIAGAVFWFASWKADGGDVYLWRCCGVFFLIFGFGYLLIGITRPGSWAYVVFVLAGAAAWCALAWYAGPRPEHLFNLAKLAIVPIIRFRDALLRQRHV